MGDATSRTESNRIAKNNAVMSIEDEINERKIINCIMPKAARAFWT